MAFDWISDNIYFIENVRKRIEVFNLHSSARRVVVWSIMGDPRSVAVHPARGYAISPSVCT